MKIKQWSLSIGHYAVRLLRHKHLLRSATSLVLAFVISFLPVLPTADGIALFGALSTKAALVTWDGGGATPLWSDPSNWSTKTVPSEGDIVRFNDTSTKDVRIDTNISVAGIEITRAYSGQIGVAPDVGITIGQEGFSQAGGRFVGRSGLVTIAGSLHLAGGEFVAPSGTLTIKGNVRIARAAYFKDNAGTVELAGPSQIVFGGATFHHLRKQAGTAQILQLQSGKQLTITGDLTLTGAPATPGGTPDENQLTIEATAGAPAMIDVLGHADLAYLAIHDIIATSAEALACPVGCSIEDSSGFELPPPPSPTAEPEGELTAATTSENVSSPTRHVTLPSLAALPKLRVAERLRTGSAAFKEQTNALIERLHRPVDRSAPGIPVLSAKPRVAAAQLNVGETEQGSIPGDEDAVFVVELDQQAQQLTLALAPSSPDEVASLPSTPVPLEVTPTPSTSPGSDPATSSPTPTPSPEEPADEVVSDSPEPSPLAVPLVPLVVPSTQPEATEAPSTPLSRLLDLPVMAWLQRAEANAAPEAIPPAELVVTDAVVIGPDGEAADINPVFDQVNGTTVLRLPREANAFHPGLYHVAVTLEDPAAATTYELTQDFTWGVLAINFDKSSYVPGAEALIGMGLVDDQGRTLCRAELTLTITQPDGTIITQSTADGTITISDQCGGSSETYLPDYSTTYTPPTAGDYQVELTATTENGKRTITDSFIATGTAAVITERDGAPGTLMAASRIYPPTDYKMNITITTREAFTGSITETVPSSFKISQAKLRIAPPDGEAIEVDVAVQAAGDQQTLVSPEVSITPTDHVSFSYTYDAPDISPELYLLGPLELSERGPSKYPEPVEGYPTWQEPRTWQIAADATKYWVGGNGDNVGTNANDWSTTDPGACNDGGGDAAAVPGSSDVATFDADCDNSAAIAANWSVSGIDITSGYIGTLTQSGSNTVTVGASHYIQADGTFTGGSGAFTMAGEFRLSGGVFTATSGTTTFSRGAVGTGITLTGGTFNHNNGTVTNAASHAVWDVNTSLTLYNLTKAGGGIGITIASGDTVVVDGELNLTDGEIVTGTVDANGTIAVASTYDGGSGILLVDGGSAQSFTIPSGANMMGITLNSAATTIDFDASATSTIEGKFTLQDGTFTASSGTTTLSGVPNQTGVLISGGTFNHNSGTVKVGASHTTWDVNSSLSLYNLTHSSGATLTVANNDTLTVAGTLALTDGFINQTTIPATGSITAQGDITQASTFDGGTGRIEINGTDSQTFTGSATSSAGKTPAIEVDKSSGTLTLSGTIRAGTAANSCTTAAWTHTAGTVDGGSSNFLVKGPFAMAGGSFTAPSSSGSWTVAGNLTVSGGTLTHNSGKLTLDYGALSCTVNVGSSSFNNVDWSLTATNADIAVTGTWDIDGTLAVTTEMDELNTGTVAVAGNVTLASVTVKGTGQVEFDGTGSQTLSASGGTGGLPTVEVNKAGGTLTIQDTIELRSTTSNTIWLYTAGTVDAGTSTIKIMDDNNAIGSTVNSGAMAFNNVEIGFLSGSSDLTVTGTMDVNGNLTISQVDTMNTGTITVAGNLTSTDIGVNTGGIAITLDGTGSQTITLTGDGSGNGDLPNGTFTVNKASGTATLANHATAGFNNTGQDLTITSGTLDLAGYNLTVNDVFTLGASGTLQLQGGETVSTIDTVTAGSTVIYNGTSSYTTALAAGDTYSNLTFNGSGGVWEPSAAVTVNSNLTITAGTFDIDGQNLSVTSTFSNSGTLRLTGGETTVSLTNDTDSGTVEYDGTGSYTGLKAGNNYYSVIFNGSGGTWTQNATLDVNGNLTITAGTLASDANAITLAGNWSNSGTYTHGNNTVTLDGTSQSLTGATTFYNLSKTEGSNDGADEVLTFTHTTTYTVANTLTLDGRDSDDRINILSSSADTAFTLDVTGAAQSGDYLDVKDSNASTNNITCTSCINSGGNDDGGAAPHWIFVSAETRQRLRIISIFLNTLLATT